MDRLIESLSQIVSKQDGYELNQYIFSKQKNDELKYPHPSDFGYYSNIDNQGRSNVNCNYSGDSKMGCHINSGNYDRLSTEPFNGANDEMKKDDPKGLIRDESYEKSVETKGKLGSEVLNSLIFERDMECFTGESNIPSNNMLHNFQSLEVMDGKRTALDIAMKYSPEDIMLSKVRGIFMNRYNRESISQEESEPLRTSTNRNDLDELPERILNNYYMKTAYKDIEAAFLEAIDDCYARFFTNLPVNLLEDAIHLYFQIQAAYWWYEDMWYDKYSHVLPKLSLRVFGQFVAEDCPILRHFVSSPEEHDKFLLNWKRYCKTIPLRGVILINKDLTKCVLVKPWNGNRFMFPRGKMDEMEEDSLCAIREAYEELGIDVTKHLNDSIYIEKQVEEQTIKLFIIPGIDENTPLEPKKRKEISEIRWFNFTSLPNWQSFGNSVKQRKSRQSENMQHSESLFCNSSDYTSGDRILFRNSDDEEFQTNDEATFEGLQSVDEKTDSNQFFRVSQFTRNLRGWIEVLKKISLDNPNNQGGIITRLPKNLNPAVIRRLQNADLGGPPLSNLPLFVRVKSNITERKNQTSSTAQIITQHKRKSKSYTSDTTKDKRTFGTKAGSGWDVEAMFALNERKFGVKSTFSLDEYTIPLPKIKSKNRLQC
ncbi:putative mRNA-decapping enzyme 2 [Cryptosporidium felis]|nr:putative mRNA-decapping enzyme 2 [Cryptosporidium felis]